jgi:ubiquinone/menaquinone biosynthesis C-methylase UbiE
MGHYALDNAAAQTADRFLALEISYDPVTRAHLAATGLGPGWNCLEVGGGGGSVAAWLADQVAPDGAVTATDIAPDRLAGAPLPANLRVLRHDIVHDPLPEGAYDLVHARLVLLHLPERVDVLARLVRSLRPGGRLVLEDFDCRWTPVLAAPGPAAADLFHLVHNAFLDLLAHAGADLRWGSRTYQALRDANLCEVTATTYSQVWPGAGPAIALHRANTVQLRGELLDSGITAQQLLDFWNLLDNPAFAVCSYPLTTAIGRRAP